MFGVRPAVLWTVVRHAAMTVAKRWGQVPGFSSAVVLSICKRVLFILSTHHFGDEMGLYATCLPLQGGKARETVLIQNSSPNRLGKPNSEKKPSYIALMHVDASASGNAKAHDHFVK